MSAAYYSEFDRWFAEDHDGSPVEWLICDGYLKDDPTEGPNNLSLCATKPGGHQLLPFEKKHVVRHRFMASSYIEACNKRNEIMGWGPYKPDERWNPNTGLWDD